MRKRYRHTEFVVISETLRFYHASYNYDFKVYMKVYMKDKPGNYGLLFRVLVDAQDRYASGVISYVTPPTNNPDKKGNIPDLLWKFPKIF